MTLFILLIFCALILTLVAAAGKCPCWPGTLFIIVALLVKFWGK